MNDLQPFDPQALVGRLIDQRFEVVAVLGAGGMGAVFRARQVSVDRPVALKVLVRGRAGDPISVERFRREAYLASRFTHPHAITVYDFGQTPDGLLYIAMELLKGESLRDRLRSGPLTARDAAKVTAELLRALAEAHRASLVHRDVKPDNIFLAQVDGDPAYVKVLDFGIAKMVAGSDDAPHAHLTQRGKVFGTAAYMSPEQIRGRPVDAKADLYAAGVVLYEMLCGHPPFVAEQPGDVLRMHLDTEPTPPSARAGGVSPELERIALRALSKDPLSRFTSADEFLEAVEGYKYNSGFYAVPARLAAMASVTDPGRRPLGAEESSDEHDAPSLGATMMLEQQRPAAAGPSPFEDDDPPFAEPPTARPAEVGAESMSESAIELMDFSVSGDADERTMMEFTDDDPDERTQFEPEDAVQAPPVAAPVPAPIAQPAPVPQPALLAQPTPVAQPAPQPAAVAAPPRVAAPIAAPAMPPAGPLDSGFSHTVDALAGEGDDEEDSVISSVGAGPAKRMFELKRPPGPVDEPTMLELEDDELEEVEPSRLVPIPKFDDDDPPAPQRPKSTLFGGPGVAPGPRPAAPNPFAPKPRGPAAPAPRAASPVAPRPAPQPARPAPAARPRVAPQRPTVQGAPSPAGVTPAVAPAPRASVPMNTAGPAVPAAGGPSKKKWLFILLGLVIAAGGAAAVVLLDPFGRGGAPEVPVGPPKLEIASEPSPIEIFDDGRFVGETPVTLDVAGDKAAHALQLVANNITFKASVPAQQAQASLYVKLPPARAPLGHVVFKGPAGAAVTWDGKVVGKLPLTVLTAADTAVNVKVDLGGSATDAAGTATKAGAVVEVGAP